MISPAMILRNLRDKIVQAWKWSGEAKTSTRTTISVFSLVAILVVVVFVNFNSDRSRDRELTSLVIAQIGSNNLDRCFTAVENRDSTRANWIAFYDLLDRYIPDADIALSEARGILDENSPRLDASTCSPLNGVPEPFTTSASTNTNGG